MDAAEQLWRRCTSIAAAADERARSRAADCVALGIAEMLVSAREQRWRDAARRVGDPVAARSLLMHARLADDTYLTACHPGSTVLPPALALAESAEQPFEGERWLRAIVAGYECASALAAAILPAASQRGWRVTAAVAPLAAATVTALLDDADAAGPDALRLAAAVVGGPLAVFGTGDGWRLQPGLAAAQGVAAARAASVGLTGDPATIEAMLRLLAGEPRPFPADGEPAILGVTFKRYAVPMYGQAVCAAFENAQFAGTVRALRVRVPSFAAAYADQSASSVTSVQAIALAGLRKNVPAAGAPPVEAIEVVGDDAVGEHRAEIETTLEDGTVIVLRGDADTSDWTRVDAEAQCRRLVGDEPGSRLVAATDALLDDGALADVLAFVHEVP